MGRPLSLSSEQIAEMIKLSATKTNSELAKIYNVDQSTIYVYLVRAGILTWKKKSRSQKIKKLFREEKINAGKNYIDYLQIENDNRKKQGLYLLKQK